MPPTTLPVCMGPALHGALADRPAASRAAPCPHRYGPPKPPPLPRPRCPAVPPAPARSGPAPARLEGAQQTGTEPGCECQGWGEERGPSQKESARLWLAAVGRGGRAWENESPSSSPLPWGDAGEDAAGSGVSLFVPPPDRASHGD